MGRVEVVLDNSPHATRSLVAWNASTTSSGTLLRVCHFGLPAAEVLLQVKDVARQYLLGVVDDDLMAASLLILLKPVAVKARLQRLTVTALCDIKRFTRQQPAHKHVLLVAITRRRRRKFREIKATAPIAGVGL